MVLEFLARLRWLGIDKTGTLTSGQFQLMKLESVSEFTQAALHKWAAAIETKDPHPLAQSLVKSYTGCLVAFAGWDGLPLLRRRIPTRWRSRWSRAILVASLLL